MFKFNVMLSAYKRISKPRAVALLWRGLGSSPASPSPPPPTASTTATNAATAGDETGSATKDRLAYGIVNRFLPNLSPDRVKILLGGGGVAIVSISSLLLMVGSEFMSITPYTFGYYGFMSGVGCSMIAAAAINKVTSIFHISPNTVRYRVADLIKVDEAFLEAMGGDLSLSEFAGFKWGTGYLTVSNRRLTWKPTNMDIVWSVKGKNGRCAVATAQAVKNFKGVTVTSLATHDEENGTRMVVGTEKDVAFHKHLASTVVIDGKH
jgi:hypothetical protein